MRHILLFSTLAFGLFLTANAAQARGSIGQWGNDLHHVADTQIPSLTDPNRSIAVCHLVNYMHVLFVPVYTQIEGYALSNDGCEGEMYRDLSSENLADLQASGLVDPALPASPRLTLKALIWGHAWIIVAVVAALFKLAIWWRSRPTHRGASKAQPDTLAIHSLVAMSQVALADGSIDDREIRQISSILTRLTGRGYSVEQVADLLRRINPSPTDLEQVGINLPESDRQIILEAALNIAVADGEIHPSEYAVVSDLANRMSIGADQFRAALSRIAAHMNAVLPA